MVEDWIIGEGAWSRQDRRTPQEQLIRYNRLVDILRKIYGDGFVTKMILDNATELENEIAALSTTREQQDTSK